MNGPDHRDFSFLENNLSLELNNKACWPGVKCFLTICLSFHALVLPYKSPHSHKPHFGIHLVHLIIVTSFLQLLSFPCSTVESPNRPYAQAPLEGGKLFQKLAYKGTCLLGS